MYWFHIPQWVRKKQPNCLWHIDTQKKELYLTFDDGPTPIVTPWVLAQLDAYQAKATFFLLGKQVEQYPEMVQMLLEAGHRIGNHTYSHRDGWFQRTTTYLKDVERAQMLIPKQEPLLFRPPYGRMRASQERGLLNQYRIVMLDILAGDFDRSLTGERCAKEVIRHGGPGAIVVFHDSVKAFPRLQIALPKVLEHFASLGYQFLPIP